jgi:DNA invertase Pin-like site-specific DNA recombinase
MTRGNRLGLAFLGAIRLSRHRGEADPSTAPERQEASIRKAARDERGDVVDWARDLDVSAGLVPPFERPELGQWLRERADDFDGIIWSRFDRALRSMADLHELAKWAVEHRKIIIFASSPTGGSLKLDLRGGPLDAVTHLILTLLAFAAQMEWQAIRDRNRDAAAYMRQQGRWRGGVPPYHLMPVKEGKEWRLQIIDRTLEGVRRLPLCEELNLAAVESPREYATRTSGRIPFAPKDGKVTISRSGVVQVAGQVVAIFPKEARLAVVDGQMVEKGQRLTHPTLWRPKTLTNLLTNKVLIGQHEYEGAIILDEDGKPIQKAPALISRQDFDAIQVKLAEATRSPQSGRRNVSMLLDVGFCIYCGSKMYVKKYNNRSTNHYYYCRASARTWPVENPTDRCQAGLLQSHQVDARLGDLLLAVCGKLEVLVPVKIKGESHRDELAEAEAILADLITRAAGKGEAVSRVYEGQIAAVEARIGALSQLPETADRVELRSTGLTFAEKWEAADRGERRRILVDAGVRVFVGQAKRGSGYAEEAALTDAWAMLERNDDARFRVNMSVEETGGFRFTMLWSGDLARRIQNARLERDQSR